MESRVREREPPGPVLSQVGVVQPELTGPAWIAPRRVGLQTVSRIAPGHLGLARAPMGG